LAVPVTKLFL